VVRQRGLYRILTNTGDVVVMGVDNDRLRGFTQCQYPFIPFCTASGEDGTGTERIFVGAVDGFVYELDRGSSFDGVTFESYAKIYYVSSKSPTVRKRYRKCVLEISNELFSEINFQADFSYGDSDIRGTLLDTATMRSGVGGIYNISNFDTNAFYDERDVDQPELQMTGTGTNVSLLFYSNTALDFGHTLQGAIVHYTPRRLQR
jgi:hypothetical protein